MPRLRGGEISKQFKNGTTYYCVSVGKETKKSGGIGKKEFALRTEYGPAELRRDTLLYVWRYRG